MPSRFLPASCRPVLASFTFCVVAALAVVAAGCEALPSELSAPVSLDDRIAAYPLVDDDGHRMPSHPALWRGGDAASHGVASVRQAQALVDAGIATRLDPAAARARLDGASAGDRDRHLLIDATDRAAAVDAATRLGRAGFRHVWIVLPDGGGRS